MSKYVPILQEHLHAFPFEFEQLLDRDGTLILSLVGSGGQFLNISFDSYLVYRKMDEGDALVSLEEMKKSGGTVKLLYMVEESKFIAWFHQESFAVRVGQPVVHYAIAAANDVIDVIAFEEPAINARK